MILYCLVLQWKETFTKTETHEMNSSLEEGGTQHEKMKICKLVKKKFICAPILHNCQDTFWLSSCRFSRCTVFKWHVGNTTLAKTIMYTSDGEFIQMHFRWHGNLKDKTLVFGFHSIVSTINLLEVEWLEKEETMANKEQSCYLGFLFICKEKHPKQYTMKFNFYSSFLILVIASSIPKGEISLVSNTTLKDNNIMFLLFLEFLVTKNITPLSFGSCSKIMYWPLSQNTQEHGITLHQIT